LKLLAKFLLVSVFACHGTAAIAAPAGAVTGTGDGCTSIHQSADSLQPILVGPRAEVGKEDFASKQAKNLVGGVLGGVLGSKGGSSKGKGPRTRRDPTRKQDYRFVEDPALDTALGVRAGWTDDGLLVSTRIEDSPEKGTFHLVYLEDCAGRKLGPSRIEIYKIWSEATLTVSWTRTTYVDGNVVSQESGGWSDSWTDDLGTFARVDDDTPPEMMGIWRQAGYARAHAGLRQVGAYFNVTPGQLDDLGGLAFVTHVTRPAQDPVVTAPFHAILSPGSADQPGLLAPQTTGEAGPWDQWQARCSEQQAAAGDAFCGEPVLVADTAGQPQPRQGVSPPPRVSCGQETDSLLCTGHPVPPGVTVGVPVSTGRTTGVIAEVEVRNDSPEPFTFPAGAVLIPASDEHQGYIIPGGQGTTVPAGEARTVPLRGYCDDVRKPPVPAGETLPDPSEWTVPVDPTAPFPAPGDPGFDDEETDVRIIGGAEAITRATRELQESGELSTPFSSDPEREREAVNQQTIWRHAAELDGKPYTKEEFRERLEEQYEEQTGVPISDAPEEDQERLAEGADDFWDAFELVGERAKVLGPKEETQVATDETVPASEAPGPICEIDRSMVHSDAESDFKMSESYKDEDKRANLREWFSDLPASADVPEGGAFAANRYPASAWAVAGRDFIGGYNNAVAKHVFMEAGGGSDWVWSTELLDVDAESRGTHTMTVTPPAGEACETLVVGAAGGVVEAWSNAIDPIAEHRSLLEVLRWVRDSAVVVASVALAPATAGASLAVGFGTMITSKAFDAEFTSNANAGAAAEGQMDLWVGQRQMKLAAHSRSEVSGDGEITSDGQKTSVGQISDTHASTLSVNINGLSALKARAEDNGVAEATLESQVGVAMVSFCRCGGAVQVEYLTDAGLFLVEQGAADTAMLAARMLEEMLGREIDPYLELPPEQVIPKAREDLPKDLERMLRDWYLENGSDEGKPGYFGVKSQ
jgi:hypothetical protein